MARKVKTPSSTKSRVGNPGMSHAFRGGNRKKAISTLGRLTVGKAWMDLIEKDSKKRRK